MNFFGGKKNEDNQYDPSLSIEELESLIEEKKNEIAKLNLQIDELDQQIETADAQYEEKLAGLNQKQEAFYQDLEKKNKKTAKELEKLEKKQEDLKELHETQSADILAKIKALKTKKKELLDTENKEDEASFEKKRANIEKRLKELRNKKKEEEESFNAQMEEIKSAHDKLLVKNNEEGDRLNEKLLKTKEEGEAELASLENLLSDTRLKHEAAVSQLSDLQAQKVKAIRREEEEKIAALKERLNSYNGEIKDLLAEKNEKLRKLDQAQLDHSRDYDSLSRRYEEEKERSIQENEERNAEIERKNKELQEDDAAKKEEYTSTSFVLDKLLRLLNNTRNAKYDALKERVEELDPQLKAGYDEYLGKSDEDFVNAREKRRSELEVLNYNLSREEELLSGRQEFLNTRFKNRDDQYRANAAKAEEEIKALEEEIFSLNHSYEEKTTSLKQKIEDAKKANAEVLRNINQKNDDEIQGVRKEYAARIESIEEQIAQAKNGIGDMNKQIAIVQKQMEDNNSEYEDKKLSLDDAHEKEMIEINAQRSKIDDKAAAYEKKNASHMETNRKREKEIADKIELIKTTKQKLIQKEEEKEAAAFNKEKEDIEIAISKLHQTRNDQNDDFNERMDQMKARYEKLIEDKNGVIENLKHQRDELVSTTSSQEAALEATLVSVKEDQEEKLAQLARNHDADMEEGRQH